MQQKIIKEINLIKNNKNILETIVDAIKELKTYAFGTEQEKQMLKLEKMYTKMLKEASKGEKATNGTKLSKTIDSNPNKKYNKTKFKDDQSMIEKYIYKNEIIEEPNGDISIYNKDGQLRKTITKNQNKIIERWNKNATRLNKGRYNTNNNNGNITNSQVEKSAQWEIMSYIMDNQQQMKSYLIYLGDMDLKKTTQEMMISKAKEISMQD